MVPKYKAGDIVKVKKTGAMWLIVGSHRDIINCYTLKTLGIKDVAGIGFIRPIDVIHNTEHFEHFSSDNPAVRVLYGKSKV